MNITGIKSGSGNLQGVLSVPTAARTMDYENLANLPKLNDVEIKGNKSFDDFGMSEVSNIEIDELFNQNF